MSLDRNEAQGVSAVQASPRGVAAVLDFFDRRPVLRFVSMVAVIMGLFYGLMATPFFGEHLFNAYLRLNASTTAVILSLLGESAIASGMTVTTPRYGLEIHRGCDAIEPMAMFVAGVVALQTPMRAKVIGLLAGLSTLLVVNFIRIVSLYYVGVRWRDVFETMHVSVWQPAFIVLTVGLWTGWALWATKPAQKYRRMSPVRLVGGFIAISVATFVLLSVAWLVIGPTFLRVARPAAQRYLTMLNGGRPARVEESARSIYDDSELVLPASPSAPETHVPTNCQQLTYTPFAIIAAFTLASPVPWRRRVRALAYGFVLAVCYAAFRFGLALAYAHWFGAEQAAPGSASWFVHSLGFLHMALFRRNAGTYVVPVFLWIAATLRKGDIEGIMERVRARDSYSN